MPPCFVSHLLADGATSQMPRHLAISHMPSRLRRRSGRCGHFLRRVVSYVIRWQMGGHMASSGKWGSHGYGITVATVPRRPGATVLREPFASRWRH